MPPAGKGEAITGVTDRRSWEKSAACSVRDTVPWSLRPSPKKQPAPKEGRENEGLVGGGEKDTNPLGNERSNLPYVSAKRKDRFP